MKVRTGDTVLVIAGRERGKTGQISRAFPKEERVIVSGVNLIKRHQKPRPGVMQSGIIEREAPLRVSNVMLLCPSCNLPTRVGHRFTTENGMQVKQRVCKRCGEAIPTPTVNR